MHYLYRHLLPKKLLKILRRARIQTLEEKKSTKSSPQFANEALPTSRQISGINGDEVI